MSYSIDLVNTKTGEVVKTIETETFIIIHSNSNSRLIKRKRWVMTDQLFFRKLATDKDLNITDRRVLDYLISIMDFDNYVSVPQSTIADTLGVSLRSVRRSIKKLKDKGIIRIIKIGKLNAYMLNPEAVYKGKIRDLNDKVIEFKQYI